MKRNIREADLHARKLISDTSLEIGDYMSMQGMSLEYTPGYGASFFCIDNAILDIEFITNSLPPMVQMYETNLHLTAGHLVVNGKEIT